jgi:hypothetical protein
MNSGAAFNLEIRFCQNAATQRAGLSTVPKSRFLREGEVIYWQASSSVKGKFNIKICNVKLRMLSVSVIPCIDHVIRFPFLVETVQENVALQQRTVW